MVSVVVGAVDVVVDDGASVVELAVRGKKSVFGRKKPE